MGLFSQAGLPAGGDVPQPHGAVDRPRGEGLAAGTEGHEEAPPGMSLEGSDELAGGDVPQPHGAVVRRRGEGLAVGTEGHGDDPVGPWPGPTRSTFRGRVSRHAIAWTGWGSGKRQVFNRGAGGVKSPADRL